MDQGEESVPAVLFSAVRPRRPDQVKRRFLRGGNINRRYQTLKKKKKKKKKKKDPVPDVPGAIQSGNAVNNTRYKGRNTKKKWWSEGKKKEEKKEREKVDLHTVHLCLTTKRWVEGGPGPAVGRSLCFCRTWTHTLANTRPGVRKTLVKTHPSPVRPRNTR